MTVITTKRLLLQQVDLNDSHFIHTLLNSPAWLRFIGDRRVYSPDDAENYIQTRIIESYAEHGFGLYKMVLKRNEKNIGLCGLVKRPEVEHPDIGFALLPQYEGKGYAFEAAQAVMAYAQTTLGLTVILGITKENNARSRKLLEKIGLQPSGALSLENEELMLYSNKKT